MALAGDAPRAVTDLHDLCVELTGRLEVLGVAVNLTAGLGSAGVVAASDDRCRALDEMQFGVGEGPSYDAVRWSRPVLTADLGADGAGRWPGYTERAVAEGVVAVFAFPLQVGALCLGALAVYAERPGLLTDKQLATAQGFVRTATAILLDGGPALGDEIAHRVEIYQAQGMIMAARNEGPAEALARMRAHAFVHDLSLLALAIEILAGNERLGDG